jgi:uncharacterized protein (DUF2249 family)
VHCYQRDRRDQIKNVMRHAGPRMIWHHPILSLGHWLDGFRKSPPSITESTQVEIINPDAKQNMRTTTTAAAVENPIGPDKVMDVREIPCSIKHGLILRTCLELAVGDHFVLLNGRDPAHLREHISASWPGAFGWDYLVQKPEEVRVKITKLKIVMDNLNLPVGHTCSH